MNLYRREPTIKEMVKEIGFICLDYVREHPYSVGSIVLLIALGIGWALR